MDAHAELNPPVLRHARISVDQAVLHFDGAPHRIDYAPELDDGAVPGALNNAPVMHGDVWVDQIAAKSSKPCEDAIFVRAREPRVAYNVGDQDRGQFPRLAHGANAEVARSPSRGGLSIVALPCRACGKAWKREAHPRVSARDAHPRRIDHNTVPEGGIDNQPGLRVRTWFSDSCPTASRWILAVALAGAAHCAPSPGRPRVGALSCSDVVHPRPWLSWPWTSKSVAL
jgi:hypothetical protein